MPPQPLCLASERKGCRPSPFTGRFGKHGKGSGDRMARGLRTGWNIVDARVIAPLENSGL